MERDGSHAKLPKLAIIATHPIQYQTPFWRMLAQSPILRVKVFYADAHGSTETFDPLYGKTFAWDIPMLEGYDHEFLRHVRIPGLPGPTAWYYPLGLEKKLADGGFDAVLIHGYMNGAAWAGYKAARRLDLPILLRGESHLIARQEGRLHSRLKVVLLRRFLRHISCCLAIGKWNREYWRHYQVPTERILTSLYSIDNERFSVSAKMGKAESIELRKGWRASRADTVFCFSGNLQLHKGIDVLIRAFLQLRTRRKNVHLVIIGEGPEKNHLQEISLDTNAIHWLGFVNQSVMPIYLAAVDTFVLPSYKEPWGLVVNEAMACGIPCIVSDAVGAGPDLITEPDTGLVFPAGDIGALVVSMEQACDINTRQLWKANIPKILRVASYDNNLATISQCISQYTDKRK